METTKNGWNAEGLWLGQTWTDDKGGIHPMFVRDKELTDEQNDADNLEFKKHYPGITQKRIKSKINLAELKTNLPSAYSAEILEQKQPK